MPKRINREEPVRSNKALIYSRVSSERQAKEGHGLEGQEHRCREYALSRGYEVAAAYQDSFTGKGDYMQRPGMRALFAYLDEHDETNFIVIFDDLKRAARDTTYYLKLRLELRARGVTVESPNFTFEETDEGEFVETVLAAGAQLERKQNARQVKQKMKARAEAGYWTFYPPPGYAHVNDALHGKLLTPDWKAPIIQEAFEGFASGRFMTQSDVRAYLQAMNVCDGKVVSFEYVKRILSRVVYAGYIEYPKWNVSRRKGHHQPLVSLDIYEIVQEKIHGKTYKRTVENEDFPLRGLVRCSHCRRPLTASWSKGRNQRYPYYRCQRMRCREKDIRKEQLEAELEGFLESITPKAEVITLAQAVIKDVWQKRLGEQEGRLKAYEAQRAALKNDCERVIDRMINTDNHAVLKALEAKLEDLRASIEQIDRDARQLRSLSSDYGTAVDTVLGHLMSPALMWRNEEYAGKRLITKLVFTEGPYYDRIAGYGTGELSAMVRLFERIEARESQGVEMEGVEPSSGRPRT